LILLNAAVITHSILILPNGQKYFSDEKSSATIGIITKILFSLCSFSMVALIYKGMNPPANYLSGMCHLQYSIFDIRYCIATLSVIIDSDPFFPAPLIPASPSADYSGNRLRFLDLRFCSLDIGLTRLYCYKTSFFFKERLYWLMVVFPWNQYGVRFKHVMLLRPFIEQHNVYIYVCSSFLLCENSLNESHIIVVVKW
jgi:hypothetical protein